MVLCRKSYSECTRGVWFAFTGGYGNRPIGRLLLLVAIKLHWIQREYTNIVALAWALLAFGVADGLVHEAGLLTVIIMGFMLGLSNSEEIKQLKQFK